MEYEIIRKIVSEVGKIQVFLRLDKLSSLIERIKNRESIVEEDYVLYLSINPLVLR